MWGVDRRSGIARVVHRRRIDRAPGPADPCRVPTLSDHVAASVRAERARRRWTQAQLAERAGLSRTTVGDIETGKRQLTLNQVAALCRAMSVPLAILAAGASPEDREALGL